MSIEVTVGIDVPLRTAYDQWTRFADFSAFMPPVRRVTQVQPTVFVWRLGIGPWHRDLDIDILDQRPDVGMLWRNLDTRSPWGGEVAFAARGQARCVLTFRLHTERGLLTRRPGVVLAERLIAGQLARFARHVAGSPEPGHGWRGSIDRGRVLEPAPVEAPDWAHG